MKTCLIFFVLFIMLFSNHSYCGKISDNASSDFIKISELDEADGDGEPTELDHLSDATVNKLNQKSDKINWASKFSWYFTLVAKIRAVNKEVGHLMNMVGHVSNILSYVETVSQTVEDIGHRTWTKKDIKGSILDLDKTLDNIRYDLTGWQLSYLNKLVGRLLGEYDQTQTKLGIKKARYITGRIWGFLREPNMKESQSFDPSDQNAKANLTKDKSHGIMAINEENYAIALTEVQASRASILANHESQVKKEKATQEADPTEIVRQLQLENGYLAFDMDQRLNYALMRDRNIIVQATRLNTAAYRDAKADNEIMNVFNSLVDFSSDGAYNANMLLEEIE